MACYADSFTGAIWLLVTAVLAVAGWKSSGALFPANSTASNVVSAGLLFWAGMLASAQLLSVAGSLTGPALVGTVMMTALLLCGGVRLMRIPGSHVTGPRPATGWLLAWGALAGFAAGHVVMRGLFKFPSDWDSLTYHIPLPVHWLQAGSLYAPDSLRWSDSANNEVLGLWLAGPYSGDFLIHLNNLPAAVLLAASAVELASTLGLSRGLAHLTGMLIVCQYVLLNQLVDAENDVAVAALFLASLLYAFRYLERPSWPNLAFGAVGVGLLAGVKFYALGYAFLVVMTWLVFSLARFGRRRTVVVLAALGAGLLLCGGYWYLRNLAVTGSPLYPKDFFRQPDVAILRYPDLAHTSFLGNRRPEIPKLLVEAIWKMTGPGHLATFLLVPLSAAWLLASGVWLYRRKGDFLGGSRRLALAAVLCAAGAVLAVTPVAVEDQPGTLNQLQWGYCPVRYGLCFLSVAVLAAIVLLRDLLEPLAKSRRALVRGLPWVLHLVLLTAIGFQLVSAIRRAQMEWLDNLLIGANLLLGAGIIFMVWQLWPRLRRLVAVALVVAAVVGWSWACGFLSERWHQGFEKYYRNTLGIPDLNDKRIAKHLQGKICVLEYRAYPLFGSRRQHRVCQPMYVFSPEWLMDYLEENRVSLVVGVRNRPVQGSRSFLWFDECLARYPQSFQEIENVSGAFSVFAFKPREGKMTRQKAQKSNKRPRQKLE